MQINAVFIWGKPDHQLSTCVEKIVRTNKEEDTDEANGSCMSSSNTNAGGRTIADQIQPSERPHLTRRRTRCSNFEVTRSTEPIVLTMVNGANAEPFQFHICSAE